MVRREGHGCRHPGNGGRRGLSRPRLPSRPMAVGLRGRRYWHRIDADKPAPFCRYLSPRSSFGRKVLTPRGNEPSCFLLRSFNIWSCNDVSPTCHPQRPAPIGTCHAASGSRRPIPGWLHSRITFDSRFRSRSRVSASLGIVLSSLTSGRAMHQRVNCFEAEPAPDRRSPRMARRPKQDRYLPRSERSSSSMASRLKSAK